MGVSGGGGEVAGRAAAGGEDPAWPGSRSGRGIRDESPHGATMSFGGVGDGGEAFAGRSALGLVGQGPGGAGSGTLGGGPAAQDRGEEGAFAAVAAAVAVATTGGSSVRGVAGAGAEDAAQCRAGVAGSEAAAGSTACDLVWRGMGGAGGGGGGGGGGGVACGGEPMINDDWTEDDGFAAAAAVPEGGGGGGGGKTGRRVC